MVGGYARRSRWGDAGLVLLGRMVVVHPGLGMAARLARMPVTATLEVAALLGLANA